MIELRDFLLIEDYVSRDDLRKIENYLDALFKAVGIDVSFSKHFVDRVNDERNKQPITVRDLVQIFTKHYRENAKKIAQLGPGTEAVLKDLSTDVNLPIALHWNRNTNMLDMVSQTIMRKKNFISKGKEFRVR